jgi:hypothetical protein
MHRDFFCNSCGKTFSVESVGHYNPGGDEASISVNCPWCDDPIDILWPKGLTLVVNQK